MSAAAAASGDSIFCSELSQQAAEVAASLHSSTNGVPPTVVQQKHTASSVPPHAGPASIAALSASPITINPSPSPSAPQSLSSGSALSDQAQVGLESYTQGADFKAQLQESTQLYSDLCTELDKARSALTNFEASCSKAGADGFSLPISLRLQIAKTVKFNDVANAPAFFAEDKKKIEKLELETSKQLHGIVLTAKTKHVNHLVQKTHGQKFVESQTQEFRKNAVGYARDYDIKFSTPGKPLFPTEEVVKLFYTQLMGFVSNHFNKSREQREAEAKRKREQEQQELKGQEQMLAGAYSGANIETIAGRTATKVANKICDEREAAAESKRQQQSNVQPSTPSSADGPTANAAPASRSMTFTPKPHGNMRSRPPGRTSPAEHRSADRRPPHHNKRTRDTRDHAPPPRDQRPPRTSSAERLPASSRSHAGHVANDRRDREPTQPKNVSGGDKHPSRPTQRQPSSNSSGSYRQPPRHGHDSERRHEGARSSYRHDQPSSRRH